MLGGPQIKSAADHKLAESILQYVFPVRVGHFLRPQILGRIAAAQLDRAKVVNDVFRVVRNAVFRVDLGLEFGGDVSNSSRITGLGNVCNRHVAEYVARCKVRVRQIRGLRLLDCCFVRLRQPRVMPVRLEEMPACRCDDDRQK